MTFVTKNNIVFERLGLISLVYTYIIWYGVAIRYAHVCMYDHDDDLACSIPNDAQPTT